MTEAASYEMRMFCLNIYKFFLFRPTLLLLGKKTLFHIINHAGFSVFLWIISPSFFKY